MIKKNTGQKRQKLFVAVIFVAAIFLMSVKKDNTELYRVDLIAGDVQISQPGSDYWQDAEPDMLLRPQTQVRTGEESYCDIVLPKNAGLFRVVDSSVIQLGKDVNIKKVRLKRGKIFVNIIPKKKNKTRFEVETRVAVAAVRGTRFVIQADDQKFKAQVTRGDVVVRRNLTLPKVEGVKENSIQVETKSGEEIDMSLDENRALENLLARVKGNASSYRKTLHRAIRQDYKRKHLIRSVKEIMADLYDADNKLENYGEDAKALDKHVDEIHHRRW